MIVSCMYISYVVSGYTYARCCSQDFRARSSARPPPPPSLHCTFSSQHSQLSVSYLSYKIVSWRVLLYSKHCFPLYVWFSSIVISERERDRKLRAARAHRRKIEGILNHWMKTFIFYIYLNSAKRLILFSLVIVKLITHVNWIHSFYLQLFLT